MNENLDPAELARFSSLADQWWDPHGELKTLHVMNPARLAFIDAEVPLAGKMVLDIGCGGGLLAEGMARKGASVTGLDASEAAIGVARTHGRQSGLAITYLVTTAEQFAEQQAGSFDVITCMELLEHVPAPESIIAACARLLKPGGHAIFSTVNRTPISYVLAVIAAEYLFRLLPKGTHDHAQFIRPSELAAWCRRQSLRVRRIAGLRYLPLLDSCTISRNTDMNYLLHAVLATD